ncbi:HNH endonuclease [Intrasporangium flavum]|uniref:HNH endonuclease n=1 Tax=Intrasporangium flavum TaxID=1428657 RepID=UPI0009F94584|nr:HNH endonuclease signature motif containing protein [Intrasporangium flavum]
MFEGQELGGAGVVSRLEAGTAALQAELTGLAPEALDDASLVDGLAALEVAKAACAAAQARLTERLVESRAQAARRLRHEARACADAGDFDGWVLARDRARTLELEPEAPGTLGPRPRAASGGDRDGARSRSARRLTLSRTGLAAEVALARRESPARGSRLATTAVALVRHLPRTLEALSAGVLNERRAEIVVRVTSHLQPSVRSRVDAEVVGAHLDPADAAAGVGGWGDRELERRVRACADRLDAEAAVERCRIAEAERRVTIRPVPDTMALVTALLPVAEAVAVHAALTRAAMSAKALGDERGKGQVMADTLVELVTGQATAVDIPVEVQVVMTDRALLAGDESPAHVPGYGPVPAGWARDLLSRAVHSPSDASRCGGQGGQGDSDGSDGSADAVSPRTAKVWVRRLFTHPRSGTLVAMESTRRLFPEALRRFVVARDGTCRTPWCDAPVAHLDHVVPHANGGATSATNGQGLCVRCNIVKEQPGWRSRVVEPPPVHGDDPPHTVETTTPTGRRYSSTSPPVLPLTDRGEGPSHAQAPRRPAATSQVVVLELYRTVETELAG